VSADNERLVMIAGATEKIRLSSSEVFAHDAQLREQETAATATMLFGQMPLMYRVFPEDCFV